MAEDEAATTDDRARRGLGLTNKEKARLHEIYERAKELLRPNDYRFENGIFLISLNRPAAQSVFESRATVKADAAQNVFAIDTTGITFAVIDGGIDATHPGLVNEARDEVKDFRKENANKR